MPDFVLDDVTETIQRVVNAIIPLASERGVALSVDGHCPPFPHHRTHVSSAVYNLISHTVPHVASGGSIRVVMAEAPGFAEIAVTDTGSGRPDEAAANHFTERIISSTLEGPELDARMAALVTESHGGSVIVESTPGAGATIRLRFPLQRVRDDSVIASVRRIATRLFARPGLDQLLPEVLAAALESVGAEAGSIWLHDARNDTLVIRHAIGPLADSLIGMSINSDTGIAGDAFRLGHVIIMGDAGQHPRHLEIAENFRTEQLVSIPLMSLGGSAIGVLQVLNKTDGSPFSPEFDLVVLETLASLAATAIANAQQADQARKAAVADAVGDISHDVKNMMTPVEGWMSMLEAVARDAAVALDRLTGSAAPEQSGEIGAIRELLKMLSTAISVVRDRSQEVQDRGAEIADALVGHVRTACFVNDRILRTVSRVCHNIKPAAQSRGIRILLEGDCQPFPHDRTHIFAAVYNLVNNAIPHVPAGGSIRVILSEVDGFVEIAVADTGKGMPPEIAASLFTDRPISTTPGGTGLGTQIVAKVAREHGGTVSVDSALGRGTTVRLRLPIKR